METEYKIVYSGELLPGFEFENVVSNLVSMSSMDTEKAQKFLSATKPTLVRKNLTLEQAEKVCALFEKAGVKVKLVELKDSREQDDPAPTPPEPPTPSSKEEKNSREHGPAEPEPEPESENPYASPHADLKVDKKYSGNFLGEAQKVAPSHGWHWFKQAVGLFLGEPWKWVGMTLVVACILLPINMIPIVGFIPYSILSMIFGGGLMLAARAQSESEPLLFSYIFKGFTHNRNQLVLIGLLYLGGFLVIGLVMAMIMGAGIWGMMGVGTADPEAASAEMVQNMPMFFLAILVGLLLSIPLMTAMWFATPLVAINDQKAWAACKLSLKGCFRNWLPFLVYGLVFLVIGVIMSAIMGGLMGLLAYFMGEAGTILMLIFPFVIMLIVGLPIMIITGLSVFTGYRDIFYKSS